MDYAPIEKPIVQQSMMRDKSHILHESTQARSNSEPKKDYFTGSMFVSVEKQLFLQ